MNPQIRKSVKVYILVIAFVIKGLNAFAQKPPTGGPNYIIPTGTNITPIVYSVLGLGIGAATYYIIKKRGPKVPVNVHLPAYLLSRNILPTPDAVNLMYNLNPHLKNGDLIRTKQKLRDPEFPEIPENQFEKISNTVQTTTLLPASLKEQIRIFKSNINTFRRSKITIKTNNVTDYNLDKINTVLNELEKNITSLENGKEETNTLTLQLISDLLIVFNQTIKKNITSRVLVEKDAILLKDIQDNLIELLTPISTNKDIPENRSYKYFESLPQGNSKIYASINSEQAVSSEFNSVIATQLSSTSKLLQINSKFLPEALAESNMLKGFAFAVYKLGANNLPITQGNEVEGQYFIQYVLPALKNIPEAYHNLSPPLATYASAYLPPAKFYLVVKDMNGKQVALQHPLIDTRDVFRNPQKKYVNKMVIVPIYISK